MRSNYGSSFRARAMTPLAISHPAASLGARTRWEAGLEGRHVQMWVYATIVRWKRRRVRRGLLEVMVANGGRKCLQLIGTRLTNGPSFLA